MGVNQIGRENAEGDIDESLIPSGLSAWYDDSDDEEETVEEVDSDVQEGLGCWFGLISFWN